MHKYTLPREYLSASQINMFLRCPKQYEFRYIKQIVSPPAIALLTGVSGHAGFEAYYQDVIAGNTPMTHTQVFEYTVACLEDEAKEQEYEFPAGEKDSTIRVLQNVIEPYITNVAPTIIPVAVEQEIRYEANCGVEVLGYVDLFRKPSNLDLAGLDPDSEEYEAEASTEKIVDYKFTAKKWSPSKLKNDLQFNLYTLATGLGDVEIHNLTKTEKAHKLNTIKKGDFTKEAQDLASNIRILRHRFDGSEFNHVETLIKDVAESITTGNFPPCAMDAWCCTEKFCGYWDRCRGSGR